MSSSPELIKHVAEWSSEHYRNPEMVVCYLLKDRVPVPEIIELMLATTGQRFDLDDLQEAFDEVGVFDPASSAVADACIQEKLAKLAPALDERFEKHKATGRGINWFVEHELRSGMPTSALIHCLERHGHNLSETMSAFMMNNSIAGDRYTQRAYVMLDRPKFHFVKEWAADYPPNVELYQKHAQALMDERTKPLLPPLGAIKKGKPLHISIVEDETTNHYLKALAHIDDMIDILGKQAVFRLPKDGFENLHKALAQLDIDETLLHSRARHLHYLMTFDRAKAPSAVPNNDPAQGEAAMMDAAITIGGNSHTLRDLIEKMKPFAGNKDSLGIIATDHAPAIEPAIKAIAEEIRDRGALRSTTQIGHERMLGQHVGKVWNALHPDDQLRKPDTDAIVKALVAKARAAMQGPGTPPRN